MELNELAGNRYLLAAAAMVAVLLTGFLVQGFSGTANAQQTSFDAGAKPVASAGGHSLTLETARDSTDRKRVTTARIDIDVPDVQTAQTDIDTMVATHSGYVLSTAISREYGDSGRVEVRVPDSNLSTFLTAVEGRWKIDSRQTNVQDVTRQYTELSLELKNKRQELQQLERLMNQTGEVEHLIKVQERMGEVRTRIQFLENQLEQLDERVDYATVTITMEEAGAFETEFELRKALTDAYRGMFDSVNLMIVGTGYLLPFAVILLVLYFGRKQWKKRQ